MELHIFHTNDVHSELDRFVVLAQELSDARQRVAAGGGSALCFDLGDHIDCSDPVTNGTSGMVNAELLRELGYDGWVLGNNETLTLDRANWEAVVDGAGIPLYCSNLPVPETAARQRAEGDILERGGVRFGVFGVTVPFDKPFRALGLPVVDPFATVRKTAGLLRRRGADVVILLSHLGLQADREIAAAGMPVDVIIGAHSHHFLESAVLAGDTWICQAGKHARAFGRTVVRVEGGRVTGVDSTLVHTPADGRQHDGARAVLLRNSREARRELATPVTVLDRPLSHSFYGESDLANLLCDAVRDELDADIAVVNGGVIHAALREGTVRRSDLLAVCATPMRAVTLRMTGRAVRQLLDDGLDPSVIESEGFGYGFRAHYVGRLHVSGAFIETVPDVSGDARTRERVRRIYVSGEPLVAEHSYSVAVCEYIALSSRFPAISPIDIVYHAPTLRAMLTRAIADPDRVRRALQARYSRAADSQQGTGERTESG